MFASNDDWIALVLCALNTFSLLVLLRHYLPVDIHCMFLALANYWGVECISVQHVQNRRNTRFSTFFVSKRWFNTFFFFNTPLVLVFLFPTHFHSSLVLPFPHLLLFLLFPYMFPFQTSGYATRLATNGCSHRHGRSKCLSSWIPREDCPNSL